MRYFFVEFFLERGGGGKADKILANYILKRTKLHHLKKVFRECLAPEPLVNAETLSNILFKRTISKEFLGEHALIPPTSAQQYHIYVHGRLQKF